MIEGRARFRGANPARPVTLDHVHGTGLDSLPGRAGTTVYRLADPANARLEFNAVSMRGVTEHTTRRRFLPLRHAPDQARPSDPSPAI